MIVELLYMMMVLITGVIVATILFTATNVDTIERGIIGLISIMVSLFWPIVLPALVVTYVGMYLSERYGEYIEQNL